MITDMQEVVLNRFIRFALSVAPARDQRAFRDDIESWLSTLSDEELKKFVAHVRAQAKDKTITVARQMFALFKKKEVTGG